jgi:hypothetical protein
MKWPMLSLGAAVFLLLLADLLAFHDFLEPHTVRDWMVLAASVLAVGSLVGGSARLLHDRSAQLGGRPGQ